MGARMRTRATLSLALAVATTSAVGGSVSASWPQWGGPTRDFKVASGRLAASWPGGGPREFWSRPLGDGYSSIVTDGAVLYTMYRPVKGMVRSLWERVAGSSGSPEVVVALDAATGKTLWEHAYDAPALPRMRMEYGPGPHATPLIVGDLVYAVGVTGKLHALDKRTGRVAWFHDLYDEFGGTVQGRGYSCSPIAYGDTIVLTVGGRGQAVMAFDAKTGRVAWRNHDFDPSPASPVLINVGGQDQMVFFHADGVAGVDPRGGPRFWNHTHKTDWGLNISTPVWGPDDRLFISSAYSGGSRMLRLTHAAGKTTVQEVWSTPKLRIHIGNAIRIGDRIYGSSGDFGPSLLTALDAATGNVAWQRRGFARATFVHADGKLVLLDEDGTLALATPTTTGLDVHAKASVLTNKAWTVPTLVGTRLYLRDRATVKALDLG